MKLTGTEFDIVMRTSLFRGIAQSVLLKIINASDCSVKIYEKGEVIYSPKSFSRSLGIILEGKVRVIKENADDRPLVMSTMAKGALFGAAALFNNESEYVTSIYALEHCKVLFLSQRLILRMIERETEVSVNYIKYLSERILFLNRKIYFLTAGTAEQRLSSFLLDNLVPGEFSKVPMPMNMLADALNMSRASLYRALDSLIESGAIQKDGKKICIVNDNALKEYLN